MDLPNLRKIVSWMEAIYSSLLMSLGLKMSQQISRMENPLFSLKTLLLSGMILPKWLETLLITVIGKQPRKIQTVTILFLPESQRTSTCLNRPLNNPKDQIWVTQFHIPNLSQIKHRQKITFLPSLQTDSQTTIPIQHRIIYNIKINSLQNLCKTTEQTYRNKI